MREEEITAMFVQATVEYTQLYFGSLLGRDGKMDRQLWAALHCGLIIGMEKGGYQKPLLYSSLTKAQEELEKIYGPGLVVHK